MVSFGLMSPSAEERDGFEQLRRANVVLPGMYSWASTVLYPASLRGAALSARVAAALALVLLVTGVGVSRRSAALGRALALHGFVAACGLTWVLLGGLVAADRLEPTRAALGVLGWVLFAFGWGSSREHARVPEDDPRVLPGEPLSPRGRLPSGAVVVLGVSIAGAAVPLALAWRVTRSAHALFAEAVAVACALALVSSGAQVAVRRGRWARVEPVSRQVGQATVPLVALAIVLLIGMIELLTT
jgi:hypothetical protein